MTNNPRFEITTNIYGESIDQEINFLDCEDIRTQIMKQVMLTSDVKIREALIKLGWTPPLSKE